MLQKFDGLQADVNSLKAARERTNEARRSRSRSPRRPNCFQLSSTSPRRPDSSWSRSTSLKRTPSTRRSSGGGTSSGSSHHLWADVHPDETPDYSVEISFPDEGKGDDLGLLTEVSEETKHLLKTSCKRSMSNEIMRSTQCRYKLLKVEATRMPHLDHFMHSLAPQTANVDRELSRIQTFVLDSLTAILDNKDMSIEEVRGVNCSHGVNREH